MAADDAASSSLNRARLLVDLSRFEEARTAAQQAIDADPTDADAWCLLAQAQLGLRNPERALAAATTAISVDPTDAWPHRLASVALMHLEGYQFAVEHARQAVKLNPNSALGFVCLAQAYSQLQQYDLAEDAAFQARELAPLSPTTHVTLARVYRAEQQIGAAERCVRQALALDPQNAEALNELSILRLPARGRSAGVTDLAAAAQGFSGVAAVDPRGPEGRRNLDLAMSIFLARVSYFLAISAWICSGVSRSFNDGVPRLIPVALMIGLFVYVFRFTSHISPELRRYVLRSTAQPRTRLIATILEVGSLALILIGTLSPINTATKLMGAAVGAAFGARIFLAIHFDRTFRSAPLIGEFTLLLIAWCSIAASFVGFMFLLLPATNAKITGCVIGTFFGAVGGWCLKIRHKRKFDSARKFERYD
jgi:Flp pilus assembly protein TadD